MASRNLTFATEAVEILTASGRAELDYVTAAGFEPHSSAERPDLLFYPCEGPNSGRLFFVEIRIDLPSSDRYPGVPALIEHRLFVQEDMPETQLYFAVAAEGSALEPELPTLASEGIAVLSGIDSGQKLAESVLEWSRRALPEPWTPGS